ncbi:hypothetical protein LOK46_10470 [Methylobacterium sp. NMS14P]|uniref:hypothetical protein n=1 Tax=Methylobacterium sp. NMS14P TaxID=2894310 RepID=UPI0023589527|nr:hypothetical protein [Methylobacterium sp. NMS14P]WCS27213.1 hypothetical protein LOK46_10470 [Methylobacterium sp. NMS14P]
MIRSRLAALALACALLWPAAAEARPRCRPHAVPVFIEGAGTVWICAWPPRRRG